MTKVYIADTTQSITVQDAVYTVEVANSAADTTVSTSGSGTSLINTSSGGTHVLNSVTGGANVTITDDNAGNLTIAATDTEDNLSNNSTSDLSEGTNQYFTDARVMTSLETVSGNIIPDGDNTRSLGSATKEWKEVFIGPGSLYIDGHKVLGSDDTDTINFTSDTGQTMDFFAGGTTGTAGAINMASRGNVTTFNDTTVNLGPSVGGATVRARGTLEAPDLHVGDLEFEGTLINQTASNQNLEVRTNGTGYVHLNVADVYIGSPITSAVKIDESSITTTAGNLTIGAFGTVDVAGHNTTAETASLIATAKTEANTYSDAAVAVLTSGASAAFDTLVEIKTLMDSGDATLNTAIGNLNHDTLSGFVANEHIDWTTDQGVTNIHAGNYTDTNTVYTDAEAISAIEGETTLDLSGTVTVDELTFTSGTYPWGETFNKIQADADRVLAFNASGSGYIFNAAPQTWFGDAAGAYFQSTSGSTSTLKPFGGQNLSIEGNSTPSGFLSVSLSGDLTADTTNTKTIVSNKQGLTIPGVSQWGGWSLLTGGDGIKSASSPNTGYPFVGISQTASSSQSQPQASYFINHMDYDISGGLGGGTGVQVSFAAQDESGKLIDIASNLCKIRENTVSGSAGSSTVATWDSEYTLTVVSNAGSGANSVGTNTLTTNVDFTEVSQELRVVNKPGNSGNTNLSGVYLTYDGAETGTPTAKIKLQNSGANTTAELITLEEDRISLGAVTKQYRASSDPTGEEGDTYFNTGTKKFRGYNGSAWVELG